MERNQLFKWNDAECLHEKFFICEIIEAKEFKAITPAKENDAVKATPPSASMPASAKLEQSEETKKLVLNI